MLRLLTLLITLGDNILSSNGVVITLSNDLLNRNSVVIAPSNDILTTLLRGRRFELTDCLKERVLVMSQCISME